MGKILAERWDFTCIAAFLIFSLAFPCPQMYIDVGATVAAFTTQARILQAPLQIPCSLILAERLFDGVWVRILRPSISCRILRVSACTRVLTQLVCDSFHLQVYMLTTVVPARQSITGFPALKGAVLAPDADVRELGLYKGCQLSMTQLLAGQEVEPAHALTNHAVDIVGAKSAVISEVG